VVEIAGYLGSYWSIVNNDCLPTHFIILILVDESNRFFSKMIKIPIILVFLVIVASLIQGMYYLSKDNGNRNKDRLVRALTIRISLSFVLFFLLLLSYFVGWIQPHGI